jgi:hypothetical protein
LAERADIAEGSVNDTNMLAFPTDELRTQLALAQTTVRFGQTMEQCAKAVSQVEQIRAELARRGEKVAA